MGICSSACSPETHQQLRALRDELVSDLLKLAFDRENLDVFVLALSKTPFEQLDDLLVESASRGFVDFIDACITRGAQAVDKALVSATRGGSVAALDYLMGTSMIQSSDVRKAFEEACRIGSDDTVRYFVSNNHIVISDALHAATLIPDRLANHRTIRSILASENGQKFLQEAMSNDEGAQ